MPGKTQAKAKVELFDPERHITRSELAYLRGPFLTKPSDSAAPSEWLRWASEVAAAYPTAKALLDLAAQKASGSLGQTDGVQHEGQGSLTPGTNRTEGTVTLKPARDWSRLLREAKAEGIPPGDYVTYIADNTEDPRCAKGFPVGYHAAILAWVTVTLDRG